tara:strand:+ start:4463 stop:4888 length:426 start_codon:yes stop_codon:yes gene_type:complete
MKISGVKKVKLNLFKNSKGDLLKFISKKSNFYSKFGEIYFNEINFKKRKGWILHKKNTSLITVCFGEVKFKLIDGRKKSKTFNEENNFILNKNNHGALIIPPGIWFSFTTNKKKSVLANFINDTHSDNEMIKVNKIKNYEI